MEDLGLQHRLLTLGQPIAFFFDGHFIYLVTYGCTGSLLFAWAFLL